MKILSQRDLHWASDKLGMSKLTVGRFGCTTTSISMLTDYFGGYVSPDELAHNAANYTKPTSKDHGGLIIWSALNLPTMKFVKRIYGRDDEQIRAALKNPLTAVILQVNDGAHWVTALRPTFIGTSYIVADPWNGDKCDVIKRYKNITGAAFFVQK